MIAIGDNLKVFVFNENGKSMKDNAVVIPACKITATSFIEAAAILNQFLETTEKPECLELITPMERIHFDSYKTPTP